MKKNEFDRRIKNLINLARCSVVDYPLHGDSGFPVISVYYSQEKKRYIVEEPIERSNSVFSMEFEDEDEAYDSVYRKLKMYADSNKR